MAFNLRKLVLGTACFSRRLYQFGPKFITTIPANIRANLVYSHQHLAKKNVACICRTSFAAMSTSQKPGGEPLAASNIHHPSDSDKKVLVWAKMYSNVEEVPDPVSVTQMKKAKDIMRIKINIAMILATVVACAYMIRKGRKSRDAGDSLEVQGNEYIEKMKALGRKEQAAKNPNSAET